MKNQPVLAVIVCVHNAPDYSCVCLDSVLRHTPKPYELIIVDDGSEAETSERLHAYANRYQHVQLIRHDTAKGYTGAANAGLKASTAQYSILLNSDTIVSPQWAERMLACAHSNERIGIVGPLSNAATYQSVPHVFDERGHWRQNELPQNTTVAQYARAIADVSSQSYPTTVVANGFCFCVSRAVINAIGYLDEETFPRGYGEENDYCLRASDAGFLIAIADDAYVYHATSKSFGVKQRESLTKNAHQAIRKKHSQALLDAVDKSLRNHPEMDAVRARIQQHLYRNHHLVQQHGNLPTLQHRASELSILFILPDCTAKSGGSQVIVETVRGLNTLGVRTTLAMLPQCREEYEQFFPADAHLFTYYHNDAELVQLAQRYDVGVATIFHSMQQLKTIKAAHPNLRALYFVQDYEPYFYAERPDLQKQAAQSYSLIPECTLFAISPWVCDEVAQKHGTRPHKITGSLDQTLFYPSFGSKKADAPITISCMIRPSTAWRGPKRSMWVLEQLKQQYGDAIDIRTFGCPLHEIESSDELPHDFDFHHYGIIGRQEVAAMLRSSDIFLDLSDFQAFGRTALEAMACGCAVVAPTQGGVHDFSTHNVDILQVDTASEQACLNSVRLLIEDAEIRSNIAQSAAKQALNYSIHHSALSFLDFLHSLDD